MIILSPIVVVISLGGSNSMQCNYSIDLWQQLQRHHRPSYYMPYFISNYSAPALEYNPVLHPLFPDKSALQAFPRCMPKLIRKQTLLHLPTPQLLDPTSCSPQTRALQYNISHARLTSYEIRSKITGHAEISSTHEPTPKHKVCEAPLSSAIE
jgi:hypothetical protein